MWDTYKSFLVSDGQWACKCLKIMPFIFLYLKFTEILDIIIFTKIYILLNKWNLVQNISVNFEGTKLEGRTKVQFMLKQWRQHFIEVLISIKIISSYKFTSKQREAVIWQFLFVSMFMCIHAVWKLGRNQNWNRKYFYCIGIYDDLCTKLEDHILQISRN